MAIVGEWLLGLRPTAVEVITPEAGSVVRTRATPTRVVTPMLRPTLVVEGASARACVRGSVRSVESNDGIGGAALTFESVHGALSVVANTSGEFALEFEPGVLRVVSISASGFHEWSQQWGHSPVVITGSPGQCATGLSFYLSARTRFTGEVVALDGTPIANARVTVHAPHFQTPDRRSDDEGVFSFEAPDDAVVVASHDGFETAREVLDVRARVTRHVVLKLRARALDGGPQTKVLAGVVTSPTDAGLAGALVTLETVAFESGASIETFEDSLESDAEGRFVFTVGEGEAWRVTAKAPDLTTASAQTHGEPVHLTLSSGATLSGRVHDVKGRPVTGFALSVVEKRGAFASGASATSSFIDADGRFELHGLSPGVSVVSAIAFGFAASPPLEVELRADETKQIDVTLLRGGSLEGRIVDRDGGAGIDGALIALEAAPSTNELPMAPQTRSERDGHFVLSGVGDGLHSILVAANGFHPRLLPPVAFRNDEVSGPVQVDLRSVVGAESPQLELVGIGAALKPEGDALAIQQVMEGGGAQEAGLGPNDALLEIEGEAVSALGFVPSIERIRGPENSFVRLKVRRADGAVVVMSVPRRRLQH